MSEPTAQTAGTHLTHEQLRELFLFSELTDDQLAWVAEHADMIEVPAGEDIVVEGETARCFHVLLSGTIAMSRNIAGDTVETTRTDYEWHQRLPIQPFARLSRITTDEWNVDRAEFAESARTSISMPDSAMSLPKYMPDFPGLSGCDVINPVRLGIQVQNCGTCICAHHVANIKEVALGFEISHMNDRFGFARFDLGDLACEGRDDVGIGLTGASVVERAKADGAQTVICHLPDHHVCGRLGGAVNRHRQKRRTFRHRAGHAQERSAIGLRTADINEPGLRCMAHH